MLFIILAIVSGLAVGVIDAYGFKRAKNTFGAVMIIISDLLGANLISVYMTELVTGHYGTKLLSLKNEWPLTPYVHAGFVLALGLIWAFVMGVIDGKFRFARVEVKPEKKPMIMKIVYIFIFTLGMALIFGTFWGTGTFSAVAPDQLVVNMVAPVSSAGDDMIAKIFTIPVLRTVAISFFFAAFALSNRELFFKRKDKEVCLISMKGRRIISMILAIASLAGGFTYGVCAFNLTELVKMYLIKSTFIEDNYVDPTTVKMQFPEEKRNLIHVYVESMENSYLSKDLGGYMDTNLIKPLSDLAKEGISFSHTESFGGPMTTTGCVWSAAAKTNMSTGLTMKAPVEADNYNSQDTFMPGAVTTGDILATQGYEQTLIMGTAATFGGMDFLYGHGNFNYLDYDGVREKGLLANNYKVFWGYEDDKLYQFAKDELVRLSETGKPFHVVMETVDTHFPGYIGKNTPTPYASAYANAISYSASELTKFVRWVQEQPFYENTTIVLIGDHTSMDPTFFKDFDENYVRTTFNLILNPAPNVANVSEEVTQNRYYANFDMFPTILASIGVKIEGERLALGTNLFSGEKTVMERSGQGMAGVEYVNDQLMYKSTLYNERILEGTYKPFDPKYVTTYKNA